jgi:hypothetical protein
MSTFVGADRPPSSLDSIFGKVGTALYVLQNGRETVTLFVYESGVLARSVALSEDDAIELFYRVGVAGDWDLLKQSFAGGVAEVPNGYAVTTPAGVRLVFPPADRVADALASQEALAVCLRRLVPVPPPPAEEEAAQFIAPRPYVRPRGLGAKFPRLTPEQVAAARARQ